MTANSLGDLTPPQYGEHQLDILYSDIDPSGYMTPIGAGTGANTPVNARSRSVSGEDLASMDTTAASAFAANLLQNRLSNLDIAGNRTLRPDRVDRSRLSTFGDGTGPNDVSSAHGTNDDRRQGESPPSRSGSYSAQRQGSTASQILGERNSPSQIGGYSAQRQGSTSSQIPGERHSYMIAEDNAETSRSHPPEHLEYSVEDLAKVPSYSTALRANPRTPVSNGLPSYQNAVRTSIYASPAGSNTVS